MDCRVLWTSFWTCWTLLNTMHLFGALHLIQTDSTASHTGRRRLCLHELATQLLHGHASARFRTPKFLEVTKRRRTQKWARRSGIITAANAACAREEKTGRRQNATHVEYRSASSTAVWWRRVGHEPRVETNARVISQWAGAECDYCRGSEYCSDAVTWNTTINVSQIKSIFAAIAVFILYITYIFQYTRQRSFLRYRNTYVTCNTGSYIDVLIWVIFDPMHKRLNYSRCIYGPLIAHNYGKCWPIFKFFLHPRTQQRSCNELIIKGQSLDPSHLKGIRYSTLWNVHVTKLLTIWNKCLV